VRDSFTYFRQTKFSFFYNLENTINMVTNKTFYPAI
jgi:hypothetical protein